MSDAPVVDVTGVALRRPNALILRDVDLRVECGEALGLFGANGSGKTTLLRILATLVRPTEGAGTVLGAPIGTPHAESVRPRIGLIGHEAALYPNLTLDENLALVSSLCIRPAMTASAALAAVGLGGAGRRRAAHCSNGMRRRAEFARMLVTQPDLLLLDEAHVGLDPEASGIVEHLVGEVVARGGGAVVVSHERERVARIVARSVVLSDGRIEPAPR
ncbi:MAG TPA: ATP-binding cassette domain-containing protein [Acidimicrobiia bacterium]